MSIKVKLTRDSGRLMLSVDAKDLHDTLDAIGVTHDGSRYLDGPVANSSIATPGFKLSPKALLHRVYPMKFDLSTVYSTPPAYENLVNIVNSAQDACRKVLEHYQPIDISVEINKKVLRA